jgi:hypothetical protein
VRRRRGSSSSSLSRSKKSEVARPQSREATTPARQFQTPSVAGIDDKSVPLTIDQVLGASPSRYNTDVAVPTAPLLNRFASTPASTYENPAFAQRPSDRIGAFLTPTAEPLTQEDLARRRRLLDAELSRSGGVHRGRQAGVATVASATATASAASAAGTGTASTDAGAEPTGSNPVGQSSDPQFSSDTPAVAAARREREIARAIRRERARKLERKANLTDAHDLRLQARAVQYYNWYLEHGIAAETLAPYPRERVERIATLAVATVSSEAQQTASAHGVTVRSVMSEVLRDYRTAIAEATLRYLVRAKRERHRLSLRRLPKSDIVPYPLRDRFPRAPVPYAPELNTARSVAARALAGTHSPVTLALLGLWADTQRMCG